MRPDRGTGFVPAVGNDGPGLVSARRQVWFQAQWSKLERGEEYNPLNQRSGTSQDAGLGSRGRLKQSKAANLLKRLRDYRQDVWRFISEDGVPFTNNLAEQAQRMSKVKQKTSGCVGCEHGADTFFTIGSYLESMHKQKGNLFDCLVSVFNRQTIQPCFAG
jgi:hypothetical protein